MIFLFFVIFHEIPCKLLLNAVNCCEPLQSLVNCLQSIVHCCKPFVNMSTDSDTLKDESGSFQCPTCKKSIEKQLMMAHIPQCYREWCLSQCGVEPICVCYKCKAQCSHPKKQDHTNPSVNLKKAKKSTPPVISSPASTLRAPLNLSNALIDNDRPQLMSSSLSTGPQKVLSVRHLSGDLCPICDKPARAGYPIFSIGQFRQLHICKKSHLANEQEFKQLEEMVDAIVKKIQEEGDTSATSRAVSSPTRASPADEDLDHCCDGFVNADTEELCQVPCGGILHHNDHYFCKASHLLRYFIVFYGARGKKAGEKIKGTAENTEVEKKSNKRKKKHPPEVEEGEKTQEGEKGPQRKSKRTKKYKK